MRSLLVSEPETYRNHGTHAEAIEIVFNPEQTSYRELLELFFQIHDPTTLNRQGNDIGASYRSAIFYLDEQQRRVAEETIADVDASGGWPGKVVTDVHPRRAVLGSRARASALPRAVSEWLHLPFRSPGLGSARTGKNDRRLGTSPHTPAVPHRRVLGYCGYPFAHRNPLGQRRR